MPQLKVIYTATQTTGEIVTTANGAAISLDGAQTFSAQCAVDVDTPSAKTFDSGKQATLIVQDLTYLADARGVAGNSITIAYTGGATAGAEVVTVVGSAISVQIETAVSTATQVKTAVDASVAASALISVSVSGTGSNAQVIAAVTPLATGADPEVNTTDDTVGIPTHGLTTGLKGQLTTTGTLPAGLSLATDYFIIAVDASNVAFASSLVNALAGTKINITDQGSNGAVNTFTSTALAGATVILQKSNNGTVWSDEGSATNITADANIWLEKANPTALYMRLQFTLTAGRLNSSNIVVVKGLN